MSLIRNAAATCKQASQLTNENRNSGRDPCSCTSNFLTGYACRLAWSCVVVSATVFVLKCALTVLVALTRVEPELMLLGVLSHAW